MAKFKIELNQIYKLSDIPRGIKRDALKACYHSGSCDADVQNALQHFECENRDGLKKHLAEYGAWDANELSDHEQNVARLLWLMAADINEQGQACL